MYPEQNNSAGGNVPGPAGQYDFIVNPPPPPKKSLLPKISGGPLLPKILLLTGIGVLLIIIMWVLVVIFGGTPANIERTIGIMQTEQEIIRVAEQGEDATAQDVRNFAINTHLSLATQKLQWAEFLSDRGRTVSDRELNLKLNPETDARFSTAKQSNTFDRAFLQTMENLLRDYASDLDNLFNDSENTTQRDILARHYLQVELLMKQIPRQ